jgi:hydroxyacylglutathione hydrolase
MLRRVVTGPLQTNSWIIHDQRSAFLVDPGAEPARLISALEGIELLGIVLTHAHWDHVLALPELAKTLRAPVLAHPAEVEVWKHEMRHLEEVGHWDAGTATADLLPTGTLRPATDEHLWDGVIDRQLNDGDVLQLNDLQLRVLHTPGHTPGGITLEMPGHLLTGDTLFPGGPGLTGWPMSDFPTILRSVEGLLRTHTSDTMIHPGHGPSTTVGAEAPELEHWRRRGW